MKKIVFTLFVLTSNLMFSQSIATTNDGRKVLLKTDNTWEYIESDNSEGTTNKCSLDENFKEPKLSKNAKRLKKHVAVENFCHETDVIILSYTDKKGSGVFSVCVKGKHMMYRMMGSVLSRLDEKMFDGL